MKKRNVIGLAVIFLFVFVSYLMAERAVKVYEVKKDGGLALKESQAKKKINDQEAMIDDFEDDEPRNYFDGESGSWNLTPDEPEVSVTNEVVDKLGVNGSKALKLTYDIDSPEVAKVGYWTRLHEFNARNYDHLSFDVRGDKEAGFTNVFLLELKKYKNVQRIDKIKGTYVVQNVTDQWQTITIPLNMFTGLFDQTNPKVWEKPLTALEKLDELVINF